VGLVFLFSVQDDEWKVPDWLFVYVRSIHNSTTLSAGNCCLCRHRQTRAGMFESRRV